MQIAEDQIISLLRERGDDARAVQRQQQLPGEVATAVLRLADEVGIDPSAYWEASAADWSASSGFNKPPPTSSRACDRLAVRPGYGYGGAVVRPAAASSLITHRPDVNGSVP